jgi:hypothetical protein
MFAQVARDQFEIKEDAIIHIPTGAEFTPVMGHAESVLIWTGEIGNRLWTGEVYRYADVILMMKKLWGGKSSADRQRLPLRGLNRAHVIGPPKPRKLGLNKHRR